MIGAYRHTPAASPAGCIVDIEEVGIHVHPEDLVVCGVYGDLHEAEPVLGLLAPGDVPCYRKDDRLPAEFEVVPLDQFLTMAGKDPTFEERTKSGEKR